MTNDMIIRDRVSSEPKGIIDIADVPAAMIFWMMPVKFSIKQQNAHFTII